MRIVKGDLWTMHEQGAWICVTTNGDIRKRDDALVMGRGIAREAKLRYPHLPFELGRRVRQLGNRVVVAWDYRLISLPVKQHWHEQADTALILASIEQLCKFVSEFPALREHGNVFLPKPGCGNGGLSWAIVRPIIEPTINRFNDHHPHCELVVMDR